MVKDDLTYDVIAEKEFKKSLIQYWSNGILYIYVKPDVQITIDDIDEGMEFVYSLGEGLMFLNLFEFDTNSDMDDAVRNWAADPNGNKHTIADAYVLTSFSQKMIGNFYLRFHRPVKPTKFFNTIKDASRWLLEFKEFSQNK